MLPTFELVQMSDAEANKLGPPPTMARGNLPQLGEEAVEYEMRTGRRHPYLDHSFVCTPRIRKRENPTIILPRKTPAKFGGPKPSRSDARLAPSGQAELRLEHKTNSATEQTPSGTTPESPIKIKDVPVDTRTEANKASEIDFWINHASMFTDWMRMRCDIHHSNKEHENWTIVEILGKTVEYTTENNKITMLASKFQTTCIEFYSDNGIHVGKWYT